MVVRRLRRAGFLVGGHFVVPSNNAAASVFGDLKQSAAGLSFDAAAAKRFGSFWCLVLVLDDGCKRVAW